MAALISKASRVATLLGVVSLRYDMKRGKSTKVMGFSQAYVVVVPSAATCLPIHPHSLYIVSNDTTADHITRLKVLDKTLKTLQLHV